jgi:hypothetical protein
VKLAQARSYPATRVQVLELTGPEIEAQVAAGSLDTCVGFYPRRMKA